MTMPAALLVTSSTSDGGGMGRRGGGAGIPGALWGCLCVRVAWETPLSVRGTGAPHLGMQHLLGSGRSLPPASALQIVTGNENPLWLLQAKIKWKGCKRIGWDKRIRERHSNCIIWGFAAPPNINFCHGHQSVAHLQLKEDFSTTHAF